MQARIQIGLTGGIGSGKSTVAKIWAALGATVIDADAISRSTTAAQGSAIAAIAAAFGPEAIDASGAMDRQRMRDLVFADPSARLQLQSIIHPLVAKEIQIQLAKSRTACTIVDIPLLAESSHWRSRLDWVCVVDCDEETQIARTVRRDGLAASTVRGIIASQASRAQRLACADSCIANFGIGLDQLTIQVGAMAANFGL